MKTLFLLLIGFVVLNSSAQAQVAPVEVRVPQETAWIGQRVPFFVELRTAGSFAGTASFDLPQLPGVLMMKIGNPVVGSKELDGKSWFVQTHEFALFSQKPGPLEVPPFSVRYSSREGFTGPAQDADGKVPAWNVEVQRPPGSEKYGFLITTESLDVAETWDSPPGPSVVGAIFKRTIVQTASEVSGIALAPAPTVAPEGVGVYPGDAEVDDQIERGDFQGQRRETITYLLRQPGTIVLPSLTYVWWNPKTETLKSKTLPEVTFEVAALPVAAVENAVPPGRRWPWLLAVPLLVGLAVWQGRHLIAWGKRFWQAMNPPDHVAARNLRRACRLHDAVGAQAAWSVWRSAQDLSFQPGPELRAAILDLEHHLFGPPPNASWCGDNLSQAFAEHLANQRGSHTTKTKPSLPLLNPTTD